MLPVLKPGMMTGVQDGGRHGWQRFGVPVCGAMDLDALAAANILVGNAPDEAVLELTGAGCVVRHRAAAERYHVRHGFSVDWIRERLAVAVSEEDSRA